jgi:hypothetical protein
MKTQRVLFFVLIVFAITLAIVVGWRMSSEAMAVVIGVIAGVAASIPTSIIIIWITLRGKPSAPPPIPRREAESDQSRIIVVNATSPPAPRYSNSTLPSPYPEGDPQRPTRRFTIIGGSEEEEIH